MDDVSLDSSQLALYLDFYYPKSITIRAWLFTIIKLSILSFSNSYFVMDG